MTTFRVTRTAGILVFAGMILGLYPAVRPLQAQGRDSSRITRAEIATRPGASDALALIKQLRPRFLGGRSEPIVYIDTIRAFSIDDLSTVPSINVQEIRFLTAAEAAARNRAGREDNAPGGVILVRTRRQATPPRSPRADGHLFNNRVTTHSTAVPRTP